MSDYYVIHSSEDGDTRISKMSADTLREQLRSEYWGKVHFKEMDDFDTEFRPGLIIIKGEQIIPRGIKVATDWEV